ncbi:MAG: DNA mismatch repair endonuclease MutL [Flavobacteriaceae bacterium]|jgi:DNA mismatch repair protein MutL|nr:DNA mismatch repair endonuclease MutL [Flavobacteriaceae bacterium]NVJ72105.1 DNA mismatch repair endonuclease MutL [Flavobacteriaceae bacterium]
MAGDIRRLDPHVANQIAAGEVVQRPSSVVKELLENAIDAGATKIDLHIENAGKSLIQVQDNGKGMNPEDAALCFERHATSKLKTSEDLFAIMTKGFRGEALASIAAVAQVSLKTKCEDVELGTQLIIDGGAQKDLEDTICKQGTLISVKNLFYNIPARRNFLKSDRIELNHIIDEFHRVALVHNDIEFSLFSNGKALFQLKPSNKRQRIVQIFGNKMNDKLVPIEEQTPLLKLSGFVIKPEAAKKTRGSQYFFVNQRYIKSPYLNKAVSDAYQGLIKADSYPGYFIDIEVDPKSVDVNIHPTKTEVKFEDDHSIYAILRSAVKHSLGQFNVAPSLDFETDQNLQTPYDYKNKSAVIPKVTVDKSFNPFEEDSKFKNSTPSYKSSFSTTSYKKEQSWEGLYAGVQTASEEINSDLGTQLLSTNEDYNQAVTCFQLDKKFIISKNKSGMIVIHQQRAHQRVLYERLLSCITLDEGMSQALIFPILIDFELPELRLLEELTPYLQQIGFDFTIEDQQLQLKSLPVLFRAEQLEDILKTMLKAYKEEESGSHFSQSDILAKALAKSGSIRTGDELSREEQLALVNDLFSCKEPQLSPFNRLTFKNINTQELSTNYFQ